MVKPHEKWAHNSVNGSIIDCLIVPVGAGFFHERKFFENLEENLLKPNEYFRFAWCWFKFLLNLFVNRKNYRIVLPLQKKQHKVMKQKIMEKSVSLLLSNENPDGYYYYDLLMSMLMSWYFRASLKRKYKSIFIDCTCRYLNHRNFDKTNINLETWIISDKQFANPRPWYDIVYRIVVLFI